MTGVISSITGVFSAVSDWVVKGLQSLIPVFYSSESGLTFFGTMSVVALGISIFFLLLRVVQNFIHLRG